MSKTSYALDYNILKAKKIGKGVRIKKRRTWWTEEKEQIKFIKTHFRVQVGV